MMASQKVHLPRGASTSSLRRTWKAPHSSVFARLASGAFYEAIMLVVSRDYLFCWFRKNSICGFNFKKGEGVGKNLVSFPPFAISPLSLR